MSLSAELSGAGEWRFPVNLTYSWMQAEFDSSFDSDFFGDVSKGDPVPYIPDHQALLTLGMVKEQFSAYLSANYVDSVCTQASCGAFEKTGSATLIDLAVHYQLNPHWGVYGNLENLSDETYIAGREPYGARGNKPRSFNVGVRLGF